MKTQAQAISTTTSVEAGTPPQSESQFPHSGKSATQQPSVSYHSMKKEVGKIADPVSFKGLKQFYNLK